jgi:hypothetical protein
VVQHFLILEELESYKVQNKTAFLDSYLTITAVKKIKLVFLYKHHVTMSEHIHVLRGFSFF